MMLPKTLVIISASILSIGLLYIDKLIPLHAQKVEGTSITIPAQTASPSVSPLVIASASPKATASATATPSAKPTSKPLAKKKVIKKVTPKIVQPALTTPPQTVTIPVQSAPQIGSSAQLALLDAINNYRKANGVSALAMDAKLLDYAQSRANTFSQTGGLDNHAGFNAFVNSQNGFNVLGFMKLGENSSEGYTLSPQDLIEKAYGTSPAHNANQLNTGFSYVGIGISGTFTDFVFGGSKK